jgi:hypothetical protein
MLVTVGTLMDAVKESGIELIAGKSGLNNTVKWVHIVENIEVSTFLEGGEIAMITGIGLDSKDELLPLIKCIVQNGGSAVIINIGPHITGIDTDVIDYCNSCNLPLFTVPWHIHIAEIMNRLCFMITSAGQKDMELSAALKSLLYKPQQKELYTDALKKEGFSEDNFYCVSVLTPLSGDSKYIQRLNDSLCVHFGSEAIHVRSVINDENIILIFMCDEYKDANYFELLTENATDYTFGSGFNRQIIKGIGQCIKGLDGISKSRKQAFETMQLQKVSAVNCSCYDDLGVYKLLFSVTDKTAAEEYIKYALGDVLEYDRENKTDLSKLLRAYIKNNGSVQDTANDLSVHRNTINYKIKKIEGITGRDISVFDNRQIFDLGFKMLDIYNR